ncbi:MULTISPECIES: serine hydrolase domain-containing protein [Streptosporangium]|uniref:CubicO group peptidase (Beta-lactamase class C family) n=1 Tax=Streptosporangium brasiliense TaxID=47480 RepID=A0ABT9RHW9_9ACTN|nr:serine hydrolase domain-containing protein [Streptosporangium brasiliense]MDP9868877.1 CubicO group peptidase (beta-lactamase class C family) [Streptosporangium brasiliense]
MSLDLPDLQDDLDALAGAHGITGAVLAFAAGDEVAMAATGVLNTRTGQPVTTGSLFQIGSVAKAWTATLVLQLVGEGRLDLDQSAQSVLPELTLPEPVTIRQLLAHTGGFEGDVFVDTGRGDDAIQKLVALLGKVPQLSPPGAIWSYNNAGYVILGRVVEVMRGLPYNQALRAHLIGPLGLTHTATSADEAILYGTAVGHAHGEPVSTWSLMRSNDPAGASLAMSAGDLLTFARAHLADGAGMLPAPPARMMREPQVVLPDLGRPASWGLGWELQEWAGGTVVGHDGSTPGQAATLKLVPEAGVAAVLLTNGGDPDPLVAELLTPVLGRLAGVSAPPPVAPPAPPLPFDVDRYAGRYASDVTAWEVTGDPEGRLWVTVTPLGAMAELGEPQTFELARLRADTFVFAQARGGVHAAVAFIGEGERAGYLHTGRLNVRDSL